MNKLLLRLLVSPGLFALCIFTTQSTLSTPVQDRWLYNASGYARGIQLQRELKIPLVIYFYADWCPYCHDLDNNYLPAAPVEQFLRGVVKVRINPEDGPAEREIAIKYRVKGYPTFLVMRDPSSAPADVNPFNRNAANMTPAQFVSACEQAMSHSPRQFNRPATSDVTSLRPVSNPNPKTKGLQIVTVPPAANPSPSIPNVSLPSLDEILKHYLAAIGGRVALIKLNSRVAKGRVDVAGVSYGGRMEFYSKAPNKSMTVINAEPMGLTRQAFDGRSGWSFSQNAGVRIVNGAELAALTADADFYRDLRLHELYARLKVVDKVKSGSHEVYVVEATPRAGVAERLYFDVDSGLLTRRDVMRQTPGGAVPAQVYFSDWREVDGVKLPFRLTEIMAGRTLLFTIEDVKHNLPVDDGMFRRP